MSALAGAMALLALWLAGGCDQATGASRIDGARAKEMVAAGAVLLDVRTDGEYRAGHLPDALHVPVGELAGRLEELPRDEPIIVYCQSGVRSASAAETLRDRGFEAHDLGGIGAWPD